ncbi:MAG: TIGR01458 family HAD-type hydrolase [Deltaproteobacteria bacterium]|nr:TIGR01458 family HAD-type hydrolase [Deltaproteobacteria bacterium]MBW2421197.1 TIGR01458 family HAD-type hydrolase [Deltaproteobacteria bacterium]
MRGVLIDLDGVIYEGDRAVEGAAEAVAWFQKRRLPHLFLTNTTSRPRPSLVAKLADQGIETCVERILTPPVAAVSWLSKHAPGPAALFVPEATAEEFETLPRLPPEAESGAASVVLGDLGLGWDFRTLNRAFRLLMAEPRPPLVALGMTRYWRAADGLRLDVAPFVKALEHASGTSAIVLGKPAPEYFEAALRMLDCDARDTALIGDDIVGDVEGAQHVDIHGVLVRTGKFRPADLESGIRPNAVLDSIATLPHWWEEQT